MHRFRCVSRILISFCLVFILSYILYFFLNRCPTALNHNTLISSIRWPRNWWFPITAVIIHHPTPHTDTTIILLIQCRSPAFWVGSVTVNQARPKPFVTLRHPSSPYTNEKNRRKGNVQSPRKSITSNT